MEEALHGSVIGGVDALDQWEGALSTTLIGVVHLGVQDPRRPPDRLEVHVHVPALAASRRCGGCHGASRAACGGLRPLLHCGDKTYAC